MKRRSLAPGSLCVPVCLTACVFVLVGWLVAWSHGQKLRQPAHYRLIYESSVATAVALIVTRSTKAFFNECSIDIKYSDVYILPVLPWLLSI